MDDLYWWIGAFIFWIIVIPLSVYLTLWALEGILIGIRNKGKHNAAFLKFLMERTRRSKDE